MKPQPRSFLIHPSLEHISVNEPGTGVWLSLRRRIILHGSVIWWRQPVQNSPALNVYKHLVSREAKGGVGVISHTLPSGLEIVSNIVDFVVDIHYTTLQRRQAILPIRDYIARPLVIYVSVSVSDFPTYSERT